MLHDIATHETSDPGDHGRRGAVRARELLGEQGGFSVEEVAAVADAIAVHSDKADVHGSMEELLKDADVLQHFLYNPVTGPWEANLPRLRAVLEEMGIVTLEEYRKSQTGLHPQVPSGEDPPVSAASPLDLLGFKLDSASTGDEIANLLVEPCLEGAAASVLFWVRDDYAFGCCASGVPAGGAELRKLVISLRARSVLQYAHDAKVMIHGIGESDALHAGIARRMGLPLPAEVCVAPVLLRETVICLLYLVSGADEGFAAGAQQDLRRLTSRAARAYERLVGEMALADG